MKYSSGAERGQDAELWGKETGCVLYRQAGARAAKETDVSRSVILKLGCTLEPSGGL